MDARPQRGEHRPGARGPHRDHQHRGAEDRARDPHQRSREQPRASLAHRASTSGSRVHTRAKASAYASTSGRGCGAMG